MKIDKSNINFTGYSNIVAMKSKVANNTHHILSMKLDDLNGHNDLSTFKQLKKMLGIYSEQHINNDIITIQYNTNKNLGIKLLDIDNYVLNSGEDLLIAEDLYRKNPEHFKKLQDYNIKAYNLLASLTKRIASENNIISTKSGVDKVLQNLYYTFVEQYRDVGLASAKAMEVSYKKSAPQPIAKFINNIIVENMETFLFN